VNQKKIKESFANQAIQFSQNPILNNDEHLKVIVNMGSIEEDDWVLDLGCGPGLLTQAIEEKTKRVVGLDLTREMLNEAQLQSKKKNKSILYLLGDAEKLPFMDGQFDCVMTRLTIHHFPEPLKIIKELSRVLKSGGRMIVSDIISDLDPQKQARHNIVEQLRDPSHVKFLNEKEILELIQEAGLDIEASMKWDTKRELDEWMGIMGQINDTQKIIEVFEESMENDLLGVKVDREKTRIVFMHHWIAIRANKK
jgi:ubiquinone/menaquinone biosynthesis C-methylase UbiE